MTTFWNWEGALSCLRISSRSPSHTVGTPHAELTRSLSINLNNEAPSRFEPGKTNDVPVKGAP